MIPDLLPTPASEDDAELMEVTTVSLWIGCSERHRAKTARTNYREEKEDVSG